MHTYYPQETAYEEYDYAEYETAFHDEDYDQDYEQDNITEYGGEYLNQYTGIAHSQQIRASLMPGMVVPLLAVMFISVVLMFTLGNITPAVAFQQANPTPNNQPETAAASEEPVAGSQVINTTGDAGGGILAPLFTPEIQYWAPQITAWSQSWGLDPNLVATVMQIESCGNPTAVSSAGAMGLFQVMPFHFTGNENGYDIETNAKRGLSYLNESLKAHGGLARMALAGYNGGINGSKRPESQWANETVRYVRWGSGIYEDASQGKNQSAALDEWLSRGGASLCNRAGAFLGIRN